ncbi:MAG TPA: EF-hand domain-containing protein [Planctomicrobium sp.]|nr:EF-hand domain-containing protein [Planctomicrobium sp.]
MKKRWILTPLIAFVGISLATGWSHELTAQDAKPATARSFTDFDVDKDGTLSLEEWVAQHPKNDHPRVTRDFRVVDWNQDGVLSEPEWNVLRSLTTNVSKRGTVPDPITDLAQEQIERFRKTWQQWDTNGDGVLNAGEFEAAKPHGAIPGLDQTAWKSWDLDNNGTLDLDEAIRVLEVAYGVRSRDGILLRRPNGLVFSLSTFRYYDVDQDGAITGPDWQHRRNVSAGAAAWEIAKYDKNKDGRLSLEESWDLVTRDTLKNFLTADTNLDGLLSPYELLVTVPEFQKTLSRLVFPGFDRDGDGRLNFEEYRLSPLANYDEYWHISRTDRDADGLLSLEEFGWGREIESVAITALMFAGLDLTGDGKLNSEEFSFQRDSGKWTPQAIFAARDTNGDGTLSLEEWLAGQPEQKQARLTRDFRVVDWNGDGVLSEQEWMSLPSPDVPASQRGEVPDPIADLARETVETLLKNWAQWDTNEDDILDATEFSAARLQSSVPGLEETTWVDWRRDGGEGVDRDDVKRVIEAAYGVSRLDGLPLRQPNGLVFNLSGFLEADVDQDGVIGIGDWQLWRRVDLEKAMEDMARHDQNRDGQLSLEEAWELFAQDPLLRFLSMDKDFDGLISSQELLAATPDLQKVLAGFVLPGFDLDGDGQLNFREYQLSPLANFTHNWFFVRSDLNGDGLLSLDEFKGKGQIDSAAMIAHMFTRLDRSGDGQLNLQELKFHVETDKITPQVLFAARDTNQDGKVSLEELLLREVETEHARLTRDFRVVDWDRDGMLSEREFTALPTLVPSASQRGEIPDPIVDLAQEHRQRILQSWVQWDLDGDGVLNAKEFAAAKPQESVPGLERTDLLAWDLDGGGTVDREEVVRVMDAAYGIRRLNGMLLRQPNGLMFSLPGFWYLDQDKDGFIGVEDLKNRQKLSEEKAKAEIAKHDQDGDGKLSPEEAWPLMARDPLKNFLALDHDLDGKLSREELLTITSSTWKPLVGFLLPGFDRDGDGHLDFLEYRLSPLAQYDEAWSDPRTDRDADGFLTLEEFGWGRQIESVAKTALMFSGYDVSGDGQLSLQELKFTTAFRRPRDDFQAADRNQDEFLDLDEFKTFYTTANAAERDFRLFDADGNEKLSYDEYLSVPSRTMLAQRVAPPDPILALADEAFTQLHAAFQAADQNGDETLDEKEFRNGRVARLLPGLQLSPFQDWNRNRDGRLTVGELRQVVDVAYGIKRWDDLPCREISGVVYNVSHFRYLDQDKDDRLSLTEFQKSGLGGKTADERFQKADTNQDGFLSYAEWIATSYPRVDPIAQFLQADRDLNGKLSPDEVIKSVPKSEQALAAKTAVVFDLDGDGELSLVEYRRSPLANRLAAWHTRRTDRDNDGVLTFGEFHTGTTIPLASLAYEFFSRYDTDQNGKLTLDESDFPIDLLKAPAEIAFRAHDTDRDHFLTLDELLGEYKGRKDAGSQKTIGRREEMFLAADRDEDKRLSLGEFRDSRIALSSKSQQGKTNTLSAQVARNKEETKESDSRFWVIVVANVLLVGGVGWYAIKR